MDKFEVFQRNALHEQLACRVAVALSGAGCLSEQGVLPSGGDNDAVRCDGFRLPCGFIIKNRAAADAVMYQRTVKIHPQPSFDASQAFITPCFHHQCGHDLFSCGSAAITGALVRLTSERSSADAPVRLGGEYRTEFFQPRDNLRSAFAQTSDRVFSGDTAAAAECVPDMTFYTVSRFMGIRDGVDTSGCQNGL